jgi:hypothetical protein
MLIPTIKRPTEHPRQPGAHRRPWRANDGEYLPWNASTWPRHGVPNTSKKREISKISINKKRALL